MAPSRKRKEGKHHEIDQCQYAYWLAAGFPVDANETMIENVITLFCEENLAEMAEEEPAA